MKIYISDRSLAEYGIHHTFELDVEQAEPIAKIFEAVVARGITGSLIFVGKRLDHYQDRWPQDFNIQEESTLHIVPTQDNNSTQDYDYNKFDNTESYSLRFHLDIHGDSGSRIRAIRRLAAKYGFDPQNPTPTLRPDYDATDEKFDFFGSVNIPIHMVPYARLALRQSANPGPTTARSQPASTPFGSLMKSYLILTRLIDTFDTLVDEGLCNDRDLGADVGGRETAIRPYTAELNESVRDCLLPVLMSFLGSLSEDAPLVILDSEGPLCRLCRVTVLLCDLALLSYVGSHGGRLTPRASVSSSRPWLENGFSVRSGLFGVFSFRCDRRRLTCLDGLLDSKPVWVFRLSLEDGADLFKEATQGPRELSVVTTIEMLADIWGPVHGIPSATEENKIIQYNISKGAIRRTEKSPGDMTYKNAVTCHWEDWHSHQGGLYSRFSRFFLPKSPDLYFSPDDLLLIGADGFIANDTCRYTLDYFQDDYQEKLRYPGTKDDEWKDDARSLALSFSKIFGISFGMTAKKIPKTTLKQTTWDAWTSKTAIPNPILLQCFYGVEVSHCTGNADRVPLKALFQRDVVQSQLDLKFSRTWRTKPWAIAFLEALRLEDLESFLEYWAGLDGADREGVMSLVSFLLEALKDTGTAGDMFKAILFHSGEGRVLPISVKKNTWAAFLRDEPNTAAYACIRHCCVEASPELDMPKCSHCSQGTWGTRTRTLLRLRAEVKGDPPWQPFNAVQHIATNQTMNVARDGTALGGCLVLAILSTGELRLTPSNTATMKEQRSCLNVLPAYYGRSKAKEVCIMSSTTSFGGMDRARSSVALRSTGGSNYLSPTWIGARSTWSFAATVASQDSSYAEDDIDDNNDNNNDDNDIDDNNNDKIDDTYEESVMEGVGVSIDNNSPEMDYSHEEASSSFHSDDSTRMYHSAPGDAILESQPLFLSVPPQAFANPGGVGDNIPIAMPAETLPTATMNEVSGTHGLPPLMRRKAADVQQAPLARSLRRRPPFHNKP